MVFPQNGVASDGEGEAGDKEVDQAKQSRPLAQREELSVWRAFS